MSAAFAHDGHVEIGALGWTFEPWVIVCLAISVCLYAIGLSRMWQKAGAGSGIGQWQAACFMLGIVSVVIALVSPLDALGESLFSAHMVQHELLMIVAAPLLVLGKPLAVWAWALPHGVSHAVAGSSANRVLTALWSGLTIAPVSWAVQALALWIWHAPALFDAALRSEGIHTLQHLSFFISALLFWWLPLGSASRGRRASALVYLFTTMVHTTVLGALLTLAPTAWYPAYANTTSVFGLTPLEDQQLGGLIMWVPGGLAYFVAGLAVVWQSLRTRANYPETAASR